MAGHFKHMSFSEARSVANKAEFLVSFMYDTFGEACAQTMCDAFHCFLAHPDWYDGSGFDVDFARLICLAFKEDNGYDVKPEYSGLAAWDKELAEHG